MPFSDIPRAAYGLIYADPPWRYRDKANAGRRGASHKYETPPLARLKAIDVGSLAARDCALAMWCTGPQLVNGINLVEAWGFRYKTVLFTWIKRTKSGIGLRWGMGHYTRANPEFVLLGVKGSPKRRSAKVHSVIETTNRAEHSRKPDECRNRLVELFGDMRRIELFARPPVDPRFDVWGRQIPQHFGLDD